MKKLSILSLQVFLLSGCALLLPPKDEIIIYTSIDLEDKARLYAIVPYDNKVIENYPVAYGAFKDVLTKAITSKGYDIRSTSGNAQLTIAVDIQPIKYHTFSYTYKSPIRGVTSMTDSTRTTIDSNTGKMIETHESVPVYGITGYEDKTRYYTKYYGEVYISAYEKGDKGSKKVHWIKYIRIKSEQEINQKTLTCLATFVGPNVFAKTPKVIELKAYRWQITKDCK